MTDTDHTPAERAILRRFERHELTEEQLTLITLTTAFFRRAAEYVLAATPPGREQSLALTALEEAKFWTNQAVALTAPAPAEPTDTVLGDDEAADEDGED